MTNDVYVIPVSISKKRQQHTVSFSWKLILRFEDLDRGLTSCNAKISRETLWKIRWSLEEEKASTDRVCPLHVYIFTSTIYRLKSKVVFRPRIPAYVNIIPIYFTARFRGSRCPTFLDEIPSGNINNFSLSLSPVHHFAIYKPQSWYHHVSSRRWFFHEDFSSISSMPLPTSTPLLLEKNNVKFFPAQNSRWAWNRRGDRSVFLTRWRGVVCHDDLLDGNGSLPSSAISLVIPSLRCYSRCEYFSSNRV